MSETLMAALVEAGVQPEKAAIIAGELAPSIAVGQEVIRELETAVASSRSAYQTTKRTYRLLVVALAMQGLMVALQVANFYATARLRAELVEMRESVSNLRAGR